MRQIPLKTLRATITKELKNLPFEITNYGQVVAVVLDKGLNNIPKNTQNELNNSHNVGDDVSVLKGKQTENITNNKRFKPKKAASSTGWVNPLSGSVLAPKK